MQNGILFSHKKGNPTICNNMNEPWGHYVSEISQTKKNAVWYHLHVESKKDELIETE